MASERARMLRESRRKAQFAKFRLIQLNLVPLVDTFVAIVFFSLTAAVVGELAPVLNGVELPEARVGQPARQELTLGVSSRPGAVVFNGRSVMSPAAAATAISNVPEQPLIVPQLLTVMRAAADSIRQANGLAATAQLGVPLAIQGDRTMRYDLLQRLIQTARWAGFQRITLQVRRSTEQGSAPAVSM
jgi:biopolymer transport protein ExbD